MSVRAGFTLVGQVAGAFVGGGPIGAAIGGMVGGMIGGAIDGPTRNTQALIDDLGAIKFDYGTTWPRVYGSYRVKIAPIWSSEKRPVAHDEEVDSKGGPDQINRTFTYEQDWLCWAPLNAKGWARIWINGKLRASRRVDADDDTLEASAETPAWADVTFCDGAADQLPWPVYEAAVGSADACAYRHRPTIAFASLDLGTGGQPPLIEVEFVEAIDEPGPDDDPLLLDVPFNGDASDVSDNPITPAIAHPAFVDYSVSGQATFGVVGGLPNGGTTIIYSNAKSAGRDFDRKFTAELRLTGLPNWTLDWGQGDAVMILGISGVNESAEMGFRVVGGVLWIACGFADPLNPMLVELYPSSLAGDAAVALRIVLNDGAAQRIDFYVNDTLLRRVEGYDTSYFTWSMGAADILGNGGYHNDRIASFVADRFLAYYDEFPLPDVVTPTAASLADIVRAEALLEWTGEAGALGAGDIDVSALAAIEVKGFLASSSPREVVAQLADVFYFGAVCSDKLYMRLRGGASVATVPAADTGAGVGQAGEVFAGLERGNDLEQAIQVAVTGPNWLSDYEPGTENSDRLTGESVELRRYSTAVVFTPAERKGRADTMVLDGRVASHTGQVALDDAYIALEPCDPWLQVDDEGNAYRVRAERENYADGVRTFDIVLDDPTVLSTVGITTERDTRALQLTPVSDTEALLIDAPLVRDADDARGFYAVARRTESGRWSGFSIFKSPDDVAYAAAASGTRPGVYGTCSVVPGAWAGPRVFDERNAVVVDVGSGTLASSTRDAILGDAGINAFAIGAHGRWLLGQFRDAELVSAGVYRLTGLLLGAGGTEQFIGTQVVGDAFVLMRAADGLVRVATDATDQDATRYYKAVTVGQAISAALPQTFTEHEVGKKPLMPVDPRASRTSGDIALAWQRRTRRQVRMIGPAGILVPLGEESEGYVVDVFTDDTFATVVRTLASATPSVTYTAAQQTTDFGSPQAEVSFAIHQISAAVGRGFALRATL